MDEEGDLPATGGDALGEYARRVLDVADTIPAGRVMTYGDVAAAVGAGGPRQVGQVMARHGHETAWWRVIHADGSPPAPHAPAARARWEEEGTPTRDGRVLMGEARWARPS